MRTFTERQAGLGSAMRANTAGSDVPHCVIALPSFNLSESVLSHYGDRVFALEHRFLVCDLMTHRLPHCRPIVVTSLAPEPEVVQYYRHLGPDPDGYARRGHLISLGDRDPRAAAAKLLDHPEELRTIERLIDGMPAVLEPWNVTDDEMAVAERLDVPINGTPPALRSLGFKSESRRLFAAARVPLPVGREDVRTVQDVVAAAEQIRRERPAATGVVVKHDDSVAGDGNVILDLTGADGRALDTAHFRRAVEALPEWYLTDLSTGGIVEERIVGEELASPSAQLDVTAEGEVVVIATHEQVLGGASGQVFEGCEFPARPPYAARLADLAMSIGRELAAAGAVGRASVDFVARRARDGGWELHALEINVRRGGTTHPYTVLRNLVPGRYDAEAGSWWADGDGLPRAYVCTDNLVDDSWLGVRPAAVIDGVRAAGLEFDPARGSGVVLHMLSGLSIDGRFGLTAIATDIEKARAMTDGVREVMTGLPA